MQSYSTCATSLLQARGSLGLIATNTIGQGDTREVGLDAMVANGFTITRAIQSNSWKTPGASLEVAVVWGTRVRVPDAVSRVSDGIRVRRVSTLLEPAGRIEGNPKRLEENARIAFQGCIVLGKGFVLEPKEAQEWIAADPRNAEVLFPYLNGEDLNSRPDASAARWVIDFSGKSEAESARYREPFSCIIDLVKPERQSKPKSVSEAPWWQFLRTRPAMRAAIAELREVLVIALVSKTVMPVRVSADQVFSHMLGVFATDSYSDQAVLSSSLHQVWAITYGSGMRNDPRYTPSDVFETFPRPLERAQALSDIGRVLHSERRNVMLRLGLGLTKLYNRINDPTDVGDRDMQRLRALHVELDEQVAAAYGWDDLALGHGFHEFRQMRRWTVDPQARVEILDRLLEENYRRAGLEALAGR